MKNLVLALSLFLFVFSQAQTIPNAGFESWSAGGPGPFETPDGWVGGPAVSKSSAAHSGSFAIQLKCDTFTNPMSGLLDTIPGISNTGTAGMGPGSANTNGYAFTSRPDSLTGWYKYETILIDTFSIDVTLTKWNSGTSSSDIIATARLLGGSSSIYTRFSIPLVYSSADAPDTADIRLASGNPATKIIGSVFTVDDLAFVTNPSTGISALPADHSSDLICFPNPANNMITVSNLNSNTISVINQEGQTLRTLYTKNASSVNLELNEFSSGIYFIRAQNSALKQIIISH